MVEGTWKFNPTTAAIFVDVLQDVKEAYEVSAENGIAMVDLMCYILKSTIILNEKETLTDIPSTLTKLGLDNSGESH